MIRHMTATLIGTTIEGLSLIPDDDESLGAPQFVVADLRSQGLAAQCRIVNKYATGFEDLAEFFEGLLTIGAAGLVNRTGVRLTGADDQGLSSARARAVAFTGPWRGTPECACAGGFRAPRGGVGLHDHATIHEHERVGDFTREPHLVRDHDHGHTRLGKALHHVENLTDQFRVERAGRLIEEHELGLHRECTSNRHTLLLPTREVRRVVVHAIGEIDPIKKFPGALLCLGLRVPQGPLRLMQRRNVDLPDPDGPTRHMTSPRFTVRERDLRTWSSTANYPRLERANVAVHTAGWAGWVMRALTSVSASAREGQGSLRPQEATPQCTASSR